MKANLLSLAVFAATLTSAQRDPVGLLIPIYEYPTTESGMRDWGAVIEASGRHPSLPFHVIVNNANGAPYNDSNPPADTPNWAPTLDRLNAQPNTTLIGYIFTRNSTRDPAEVKRGIDQYAAWTTSGTSNITISGVFFDEFDTNPAKLDYNLDITRYAKTTFSSLSRPGPHVVLNPGVRVAAGSESLYDEADVIVAIETCHTRDSNKARDPLEPVIYRCPTDGYIPFDETLLQTNIPADVPEEKAAVILHDYYESWYEPGPYEPAPLEILERDVNDIVAYGVHSFYITQYGYTTNFTEAPASIDNVAELAARAQGLA